MADRPFPGVKLLLIHPPDCDDDAAEALAAEFLAWTRGERVSLRLPAGAKLEGLDPLSGGTLWCVVAGGG
jgi:hypothetical protein